MMRIDVEQHAATARLRRKVKWYQGQRAFRRSAFSSEGNRGGKRDGASSSGRCSGWDSLKRRRRSVTESRKERELSVELYIK